MRMHWNRIQQVMLVATCLCVGCGSEQEAAEKLQALGFQLVHDARKRPSVLIMQGDADKMTSAIPLLPELSHLRAINALNSAATDEVLAAVGKIRSLTSLNLSGTPVTDVGIRHLTGLSKLSDANLSQTKITSACLVDLGKFTRIDILNLSNNDIDGGFEHLSSCKDLTWLVLGGLKISDGDAAALAKLVSLKRISLPNAEIPDSAVKILKDKGIDVDLGDAPVTTGRDGDVR